MTIPRCTPRLAHLSRSSPCFVIDDEIVARYGSHATRLAFLADSLTDLDSRLRAIGGALVVRRGRWADAVIALARSAGAGRVHLADDYSAYAKGRLSVLERSVAGHRIEVIRHPGVTVVPPGELAPAGGFFFQVFAPYFRRWQSARLRPARPAPAAIRLPAGLDPGRVPGPAELTVAGAPARDRPRGGETAGLSRLGDFGATALAGYEAGRDDLAGEGVSRLSPYLHLGCLSPRAVMAELAGRPGSEAFIRQLAWRDFFHQVLAARPEASWRDYRGRGDTWRDDGAGLRAWQRGQTGYPIVDAAMRQLAAEGFMHNRARMIVASFLTKDLYLDWRLGAAHFMRLLADGDIACNQLNWQWVAGTGTDTSAHRIFSPVRQSRRFDPGGGYLRRYLPELARVPGDAVHEPDAATRHSCGYPEPIVDHRAAIAEYRARTRAGAASTAPAGLPSRRTCPGRRSLLGVPGGGQPSAGSAVTRLRMAGQQRRGDRLAALLTPAVLAAGQSFQRRLDLRQRLPLGHHGPAETASPPRRPATVRRRALSSLLRSVVVGERQLGDAPEPGPPAVLELRPPFHHAGLRHRQAGHRVPPRHRPGPVAADTSGPGTCS